MMFITLVPTIVSGLTEVSCQSLPEYTMKINCNYFHLLRLLQIKKPTFIIVHWT